MTEVAQEHDVEVLGPEVNDRHLVFRQALGRLEDVDRLEPDAAKDRALRRQLERADRLERRHDLAEMAVITVVFVADDDEVGGLGDRLVSARVRRSIRVEDDPQALGLDQERRVAVPGDPQGGISSRREIISILVPPVCYDIRPSGWPGRGSAPALRVTAWTIRLGAVR